MPAKHARLAQFCVDARGHPPRSDADSGAGLVARGDLANEQAAMLKGLKIVPVIPRWRKKTGPNSQTAAIDLWR